MYSGKSLSPQKLSAYTALALSIPITLGIFIFKPVWWIALLSFIAICAGSYGLILFTLQRFIYRKLKLIYKLIYHTKATKREELYYKSILPQNFNGDPQIYMAIVLAILGFVLIFGMEKLASKLGKN